MAGDKLAVQADFGHGVPVVDDQQPRRPAVFAHDQDVAGRLQLGAFPQRRQLQPGGLARLGRLRPGDLLVASTTACVRPAGLRAARRPTPRSLAGISICSWYSLQRLA